MVTDGETTGGAKSYFFWSSLSASPPSWWMFCFRRRSMDSVQQTWKETPWKKIEICDSKGQSKEFILVVTGEEGSVSAHPYVRPGRNLIVASWFFFLWAQTIWLTQGAGMTLHLLLGWRTPWTKVIRCAPRKFLHCTGSTDFYLLWFYLTMWLCIRADSFVKRLLEASPFKACLKIFALLFRIFSMFACHRLFAVGEGWAIRFWSLLIIPSHVLSWQIRPLGDGLWVISKRVSGSGSKLL